MFVSVLPSEDGGEIDKPTSCNYATSLHQEIDHCKREGEETIQYQ